MQFDPIEIFAPLMMGLAGLFSILFGRWHDKQLLKKMNADRKDQHPQPAE